MDTSKVNNNFYYNVENYNEKLNYYNRVKLAIIKKEFIPKIIPSLNILFLSIFIPNKTTPDNTKIKLSGKVLVII